MTTSELLFLFLAHTMIDDTKGETAAMLLLLLIFQLFPIITLMNYKNTLSSALVIESHLYASNSLTM